MLTTYHVHV